MTTVLPSSPGANSFQPFASRVEERSAPVLLGSVAGGVDPEDPGGVGRGDDPLGAPRRAVPVPARAVEPAGGVADDRDPVRPRVVDGLAEAGGVADADEVEVGRRGDLGDDLRDGSPVAGALEAARAAEVDPGEASRQVAARLAAAVVGEAEVDDRDLHALAVDSRPVPRGRRRGPDAFSVDGIGDRPGRLAHDADRGAAREPSEGGRRHSGLDHSAVRDANPAPARRHEPASGVRSPARSSTETNRVDRGDRRSSFAILVGTPTGCEMLLRHPERTGPARGRADTGDQPTQHPQHHPPHETPPPRDPA